MQNYKNHVRYYTLHHLIYHPVTLGLFIAALYFADKYTENRTAFYLIAAVVVLVGWLSVMLRQHYALILQNRIVRLEMRLRYYQLSGRSFADVEQQLTLKQIAALRFASDEELQPLIEQTITEQLSPDNIKKRITNWQPDHMRV